MDSGVYAAYTGLMARTQALDTAANNLANAGTNGFRAQRDYFRDVMAGMGSPADATTAAGGDSLLGRAVNDFGVLGGNALDMGQGAITATGNPLDLALDGAGFFAIMTANGTRYTRDGGFTRSQAGVLETSQGEPVLDAKGNTITIPTGAVSVAGDGSVSVAGPEGSAIVGQVGIYDFAGSALTAEGANRFVAATGAQVVAGTATVRQGAVEGANQDAVHGTMQLLLVQRQAEMMQKALSVFNNDLDKTAAEELGKV
jgi:flagellar basal-body rod protein FlgF/flagellar basal-body rod protein FlgG